MDPCDEKRWIGNKILQYILDICVFSKCNPFFFLFSFKDNVCRVKSVDRKRGSICAYGLLCRKCNI